VIDEERLTGGGGLGALSELRRVSCPPWADTGIPVIGNKILIISQVYFKKITNI
jgi:hypothetical protein